MARILVVEDNPANLELMTYLLKAFRHTPLAAHNGVEGLELARREQPDLVVCDVQLPRLDGYEVARQLKADPRLRAVPLVAVTALAMAGDRDKALAAGFDGYVAKPISPSAFVGQVEAFLPANQRSNGRPTVPTDNGPSPPAEGATILVVDNSPVNIDLARSMLEPFGYQVIVANKVREALALARRTPPDLILSDVHMPDESGFDFVKAVKADPRLRSIPFAFISSTVWPEEDLKEGLALGAGKFLLRPIEPQVLLGEIEAFLSSTCQGSRAQREVASAPGTSHATQGAFREP